MMRRLGCVMALVLAAVGCKDEGGGNSNAGTGGTAGASGQVAAGEGGAGVSGAGAGIDGVSGTVAGSTAGTVAGTGDVDSGIGGDVDAGGDGVDGTHSGACTGDFDVRTNADVAKIVECTSIDGMLTVESTSITSLALPNLASVGKGVQIAMNQMLTSVSLPLIHTTGDYGFDVSDNWVLTGLSVPALTEVMGGFTFYGNNIATSLAVPELVTIGGSMQISSDFALPSLSMPKLASIGDYLQVSGNSVLTDVSFPVLKTVSGDTFNMSGNAMLPSCQAEAVLAGLTGFTGNSSTDNGPGTCP